MGVIRSSGDLAAEGAEAEGVDEAPLANLAGVGDALARPGLRPLVEEDDSGAIDDVGVDTAYIQHLLYLRNSYYIVVRRSPYLDGAVVAVVGEAEGADRPIHAVKTVHIALAFVRVGMLLALDEEARRQQGLQPRRPPAVIFSSLTLSPHGFAVVLELHER